MYVWGNTYPVGYAENGIITQTSICNKSIQVLLNLYNLLHNSERVMCTAVVMCVVLVWTFLERTIFSRSWHIYFASVERWLVRDLVSALRSRLCADVLN